MHTPIRRHMFFRCHTLLTICAAIGFLTLSIAPPSHAQLGNWLRRQIGNPLGSKNQNHQNNSQNNGNNAPPRPGPNGGYYIPVQQANPITGMTPQSAATIVTAPPGLTNYNQISQDFSRRPDPKKAEKLRAQGEQQLEQKQYPQAEQTLFDAYTYDRQNPYVLNDLGVVCDRTNYMQAALMYYKIAATFKPDFAQAYYNAGLDDYAYAGGIPAWPYFTKALQLDGSHADWWYWIGNDKVINGDASDGLYYYTQAVKLDGKFADAYCWKGVLELRLKKDAQAHADLQKARTLNPNLGPPIAHEVSVIMAARKVEAEMEAAAAREAARERQAIQEARAYYGTHQRSINSIVARGPRYYQAVYAQARDQGESPEEASQREQAAREQYDKDVALQNAWENNDYTEMDRINSGDASADEISNYDASSSPTAAGAMENNDNDSGGSSADEPEVSAPAADEGGGGDE